MSDHYPIPREGAPLLESQKHPAGYITAHFCRRARDERIKQGLTQQAFADRLQVSLDTIQRHESGKIKYVRLDFACDIAAVLNVPLQSLLPPCHEDIESYLQQVESAIASVRELTVNSNLKTK